MILKRRGELLYGPNPSWEARFHKWRIIPKNKVLSIGALNVARIRVTDCHHLPKL